MPRVNITTGLPGSGKSTHARTLNALRFNLDDYRAMMGYSDWGGHKEKVAVEAMLRSASAAVEAGHDITLDNTHLTPRLPTRYKALLGGVATFVVHDFTHVPIEECLRRDAARENAVGEDVIRRLADNHAKATKNGWRLTDAWMNDTPAVEPYTPDVSLPSAIMCDIDGTLALMGDRGPYDFARCGEDGLNESVRRALRSFRLANDDWIVLLSGRGEEYRPQTEKWLAAHEVPYDELWMRPAGDTRRDDIVKAELFDAHLRRQYNVRVSLDDRDRVVALWRRMGLPTWQVNYGNF